MGELLASLNEKMDLISLKNVTLNDQSKEITVYAASYIVSTVFPGIEKCCSFLLCDECEKGQTQVTFTRAFPLCLSNVCFTRCMSRSDPK